MGFSTENCTLSTCPLSYGQVFYQPSLGGNAFYMTVFSLAVFFQLIFGIRYRTWSFFFGMFCGLVLEVVGYAARIQMHFNPFKKGPFVMYVLLSLPSTAWDGHCQTSGNLFFKVARNLAISISSLTTAIWMKDHRASILSTHMRLIMIAIRYLVALTIGPTFFTASIYLCLARIIVLLSESLSRFKPRTYTLCFISSDVISLVL